MNSVNEYLLDLIQRMNERDENITSSQETVRRKARREAGALKVGAHSSLASAQREASD
jgi:hypothetical protein